MLDVTTKLPYLNLFLCALTIIQGTYLFLAVPEKRIKTVGVVSSINVTLLSVWIVSSLVGSSTDLQEYHSPINVAVLLFTIQISLWVYIALSKSAFGITPVGALKRWAKNKDES